MVSVVHSLQPASGEADALSRLCAGLPEEAAKRAAGAFVLAREAYGEKTLGTGESIKAQIEVLRKMLLAMVEDIRVVLLRLASRTQTLRYYAGEPDELRVPVARETLALYSPLANRLGIWELKWELEDLSFRFLHPAIYKEIAQHARREANRARAVHHRSQSNACRPNWSAGVARRGLRPAQTHLQHLEQDAQEGRRLFRGVRRACRARHRR
jgi:hypothetical protein